MGKYFKFNAEEYFIAIDVSDTADRRVKLTQDYDKLFATSETESVCSSNCKWLPAMVFLLIIKRKL